MKPYISVSRRFALGSRSNAGGSGRRYFCELKTEQPQPSRLAREAVPGADKRSWDAGGGVDVCWKQDPCCWLPLRGIEVLRLGLRVLSSAVARDA